MSSSRRNNLEVADLVRKILGDGEPHFELEIHLAVLKVVPPELAVRRGNARHVKGASESERSLQRQLMLGVRDITRPTIGWLTKRKEIVAEEIEGKRAFRLIDEEQLAWNRAVAERFRANGGPPAPAAPEATEDGEA